MPATMAASDWLSHQELKIIKGVFAAPGDNNTVEPTIQTLNLMDNASGVALTSDGWMPGLPSIEGSGVWQDSPLDVGRRPLILQESNVTEKMQLNITGSSFSDVTKKMMLFTRMALDCRAFWTDNAQINPVYLKWWASCGAGPQYALLYNMEVDFQYMNSPMPSILATITLEREPYWRAIPPGANPRQWTFEFYKQVYNVTSLYAITDVSAATNQLITGAAIAMRSEFTSANFDALLSNNCMIIDGSLIPGDAPALLEFYFQTTSPRRSFLMGKKTTKIAVQRGGGTRIAPNAIMTAPDGNLGIDATLANDAGAVKAAGAANAQRVEISFATATNQLRWNTSAFAPNTINRYIGRWMLFLRCRQINGAVGDITMYLRYSGSTILDDTSGVKLNVVNPPLIGTNAASTDWGLVYMGVINIPIFNAKAAVTTGKGSNPSDARGLDSAANFYTPLNLGLFASKVAGTQALYLCDLIFMPIDEGSITVELGEPTTQNDHFYDDTGYFSHGTPDTFVVNAISNSVYRLDKLTGPGISLTPGVENRIYIMTYDSSNQSRPTDLNNFYGNIVPRWRGIRDVANVLG